MTRRIHLQAVGDFPAIPVSEVEPGMKIMYNFGMVYEVVSVTPNPKGTALFLTVQGKDGKQYTQQKRPTTLVAAF